MRQEIAEPFRPEPRESISSLIGELLGDAQQLIRQEVALVRIDFQEAFSHHKVALRRLTAAMVTSLLGCFWLSLCLVYLLNETAGFSLWQSFGSVGVGMMISGRLLFHRELKRKEIIDGKSNGRTGKTEHGNTFINSP